MTTDATDQYERSFSADNDTRGFCSLPPTAYPRALYPRLPRCASRPQRPRRVPDGAALLALIALVRKYTADALPLLPEIIEGILTCLDPSEPALRKACMKISSKALFEVARRFPMVSFHQDSQRFAVGTRDCVIIIFDLRTATKWRILEGHTAPLYAVEFSANGANLASYSAVPIEENAVTARDGRAEVKLWQVSVLMK